MSRQRALLVFVVSLCAGLTAAAQEPASCCTRKGQNQCKANHHGRCDVIERQLQLVSNAISARLDVSDGDTRLDIEGTRWNVHGGGKAATIEFLKDGRFLWNDRLERGSWKQDARSITIEKEDSKSAIELELTLNGDKMSGTWEPLTGDHAGRKGQCDLKRIKE